MGNSILNMIIKTILLFAVCVLVPVKIFASSELEKVTLQLQWKDQFEFAGFYAAKEKGFYKEVGLDVDFKGFESGVDIIDEVLEGRAEYGVVYSTLISRYLEGDPLVFVANFFKHSPLVIVAQKEFQLPSDLRGKKVMGAANELNGAPLLMMFKKFDMTVKDFQKVTPTFELDDFIEKKVDAMVVFTTNETYHLDEAGIAYNIMNPASYGIPFYDLNLFTTQKELKEHPARVASFKAASIKGWKYALAHKEEIIQLILKKYNTLHKSYEALKYEATQIEHIMLPSIYDIGSIDPHRVELTAENFIELHLLKKEAVVDLQKFIYREPQKDLKLTPEEVTYLNGKHEITYCADPAWMPFSSIIKNEHNGMDADYMQYFRNKINIPFKLIPTKSWSQSIEAAMSHRCDILSLVMETPKRKKHFDFTKSFLSVPLVLATTIDKEFIADISEIGGVRLGMVKGYAYTELFRYLYPSLRIIEIDTVEEGLQKVAKGELYGFIDNLTTLGLLIQKKYIGTLKISAKLDKKAELGFAVRKDAPLLRSILDKAINTLDERTKQTILNRWTNVTFEEGLNYSLIWKMIVGFLLIFLFLYYHYRIIKKHNKKLKELSIKDSLSGLYNRRHIDEMIASDKDTTNTDSTFSLILIDIDNFKAINDTYGHDHGDKTIIKISELLRKNVRGEDSVSRWGGEEFLIFCPHTTIEEATFLAERIRHAIEKTSFNTTWQVTASIGVAQYSSTESSTVSYIKKVDDALSEAKKAGKNQVFIND